MILKYINGVAYYILTKISMCTLKNSNMIKNNYSNKCNLYLHNNVCIYIYRISLIYIIFISFRLII